MLIADDIAIATDESDFDNALFARVDAQVRRNVRVSTAG